MLQLLFLVNSCILISYGSEVSFFMVNEKELESTLKDDKFMESVITSVLDPNFYISECEAVYTLKECLESTSDEVLKSIYMVYTHLFKKKKKDDDKDFNRKKAISFLEKHIPSTFEEFLPSMKRDDSRLLDEFSSSKKHIERANITLLSNGFMFGFRKNGKEVYVVPLELISIYLEYKKSGLKHDKDLITAELYLTTLLVLKGVVSKKFILDNFKNRYQLNLTEEEIHQIITKKVSYFYKDEYCALIPTLAENIENVTESLLECSEILGEFVPSVDVLDYYFLFLVQVREKLEQAFTKKNRAVAEEIIQRICFLEFDFDEMFDSLKEKFQFSKKEKERAMEILEENKNHFRYWQYSGRTCYEFERELCLKDFPFDKKPKQDDLETCLKSLDEECYQIVCDCYFDEKVDISVLKDKIIEDFKDDLEFMPSFLIKCLIRQNHELLTELIENDWIKWGYCFLYQKNKEFYAFFPSEIYQMLLDYNKDDSFEEDSYLRSLISDYIHMNGIIHVEKLMELLSLYHDISLEKEEVIDIVKELDAYILSDEYFSWFPLDEENIDQYMKVKSLFPKYKKVDFEQSEKELDCFDIIKEWSKDWFGEEKGLEFAETIIYAAKMNCLFDETLDSICEDTSVHLKKNQIKQLLDLYKEYKKYISVIPLNGFTAVEVLEMNQRQTQKIGRNDPCTCGSGKKYKKCCGR